MNIKLTDGSSIEIDRYTETYDKTTSGIRRDIYIDDAPPIDELVEALTDENLTKASIERKTTSVELPALTSQSIMRSMQGSGDSATVVLEER